MLDDKISSAQRLQELAHLLGTVNAHLTEEELFTIKGSPLGCDRVIDQVARRLLPLLRQTPNVRPVLRALGGPKCQLSAVRGWLRQSAQDQQELATASS